MSEEEKRLHRCSFAGHRPEKLSVSEEEARAWLSLQIDDAIAAGYTTFISGCAMGADLWAAQLVIEKRKTDPRLHLIAATPYPGFNRRWKEDWRAVYDSVLAQADLTRTVCPHYEEGSFLKRSRWMLDHSSRLIALYNGEEGSAKTMTDEAREMGIEVIERITSDGK